MRARTGILPQGEAAPGRKAAIHQEGWTRVRRLPRRNILRHGSNEEL